MGFDLISKFLFPAPPATYTIDSFPEELIWVPKNLDPTTSTPEECIPCLFLPYYSARFLIFYLHSNAEDLGKCYQFCCVLREQFQVHVLAVEYPGYGICPGGPCSEQKVTENAFGVFRFVREVLKWPLDSILVLGRSIGTGPAISLAVQYQISGVILISPFLSVKEIVRDAVGLLSAFVDERFPNKERVPHIRSPLLVVHGKKDALINFRHGEQIFELCRSRKLLVCPKEMEHNTNLLTDVGYFVLPMLQFFALPDYCFDDIQVPQWAYDKRLSPYFRELSPISALMPSTSPTSFYSAQQRAEKSPEASNEESLDERALEQNVARAVERIFSRKDGVVERDVSITELPSAMPGARVDSLFGALCWVSKDGSSKSTSGRANANGHENIKHCSIFDGKRLSTTPLTESASRSAAFQTPREVRNARQMLTAEELREIVGDLEKTLAIEPTYIELGRN